jgi:hypothetical protein
VLPSSPVTDVPTTTGVQSTAGASVHCRLCGEFTSHVVQTRHAAEGILRLRRCRNCKHVYRTLEAHHSEKHGSVVADYAAVAPHTAGGRFRNG